MPKSNPRHRGQDTKWEIPNKSMRITRRGARRDRGTDILLEEDVTKRKTDKWSAPEWNGETREVTFQGRGRDRNSNYKYNITFTAAEIISFLELSVPALTGDVASRAVCLGAIASLQQLLTPPMDVPKK